MWSCLNTRWKCVRCLACGCSRCQSQPFRGGAWTLSNAIHCKEASDKMTSYRSCVVNKRWCEQNLDGVNKSFKSVINMCMVWTKLWRCDLVNWWCEQIFFGVIKCWWCDETIFRCEQTSIFWKLCDHTVWCDVFTCFFLMCGKRTGIVLWFFFLFTFSWGFSSGGLVTHNLSSLPEFVFCVISEPLQD